MEFTDLFFNERAQIVRISINIEGETKERQEKLSKMLKGKNSDKKLYKCGYSLTTKLR